LIVLGDDAFESHLAGIAFDMLVEPDTGTSLGQDRCERRVADLERITPQVAAVELDQFGSLSLVVRVDLPHQRRPRRQQPNLLVASANPLERAVVSIF
jgi:hypothetical protein